MIFQLIVSMLDEIKVIKVIKKDLDSGMQPHFQVPEQGQITDNTDGFLQIRTSQFFILLFLFFSDFDLFKITDTEQHSFLSVDHCLKVEKVIIFILVM